MNVINNGIGIEFKINDPVFDDALVFCLPFSCWLYVFSCVLFSYLSLAIYWNSLEMNENNVIS